MRALLRKVSHARQVRAFRRSVRAVFEAHPHIAEESRRRGLSEEHLDFVVAAATEYPAREGEDARDRRRRLRSEVLGVMNASWWTPSHDRPASVTTPRE